MKTPASCFAVALGLGAITLTPGLVRAQDFREEGPFEIEKCQTINKPGSYKLVNNLVAESGDCLVITASLVTIDLAGFTITGSGATPPPIVAGISATGVGGITVRNGSISNFFVGVNLGEAGTSIVEGLQVAAGASRNPSGSGIGANGIVKGNTVSGYTRPGVGIGAKGIVTGNLVVGNDVGISAGAGSTVIGNTSTSEGAGIVVDCPSNVTNNTAVGALQNLVLNGDGCNDTNNVAP